MSPQSIDTLSSSFESNIVWILPGSTFFNRSYVGRAGTKRDDGLYTGEVNSSLRPRGTIDG